MSHSGNIGEGRGMAGRSLLKRTQTGYESYNAGPGELSPICVTAQAAVRLLDDGAEVALPHGWDFRALRDFTWSAGYYDQVLVLTTRQAQDIAQLASNLLDSHHDLLDRRERQAAADVLGSIKP